MKKVGTLYGENKMIRSEKKMVLEKKMVIHGKRMKLKIALAFMSLNMYSLRGKMISEVTMSMHILVHELFCLDDEMRD